MTTPAAVWPRLRICRRRGVRGWRKARRPWPRRVEVPRIRRSLSWHVARHVSARGPAVRALPTPASRRGRPVPDRAVALRDVSCPGRGSISRSTTECSGPGRPGGRRSCRARRRRRGRATPNRGHHRSGWWRGGRREHAGCESTARTRPALADLMSRTFGFDVLACARCDGRLRLIALIDHTPAVQKVLRPSRATLRDPCNPRPHVPCHS